MGLFDRWADSLERKNIDSALREIARDLQAMYGEKNIEPEETRAYILTRQGWTPELWEATASALKMLRFEEPNDAVRRAKLDLVGIAFVDNNYARREIGKKLATSPIPLYDTQLIANTLFSDLTRFFNQLHNR